MKCLLILLMLAGSMATEAIAVPTQFKILPAEGAISGANFVVDAYYASAHKIEVPAPFAAIIPFDKTSEPMVVHAPKPGNAFSKINFASADGKRLLETLLFVPVVVPQGPREARIKAMTSILTDQAFPMAARGHQSPRLAYARQLTIGGQDASEVVGAVDSQSMGRQYLRIVGVLNPIAPNCILIVTSIAEPSGSVVTPSGLAKTRTGRMIASFRYLKSAKTK